MTDAKTINTVDLSRRPDPFYITNPNHGGKVTCVKCNGFILEGEGKGFLDHQHLGDFPSVWFHNKCYNSEKDFWAYIMN